MNKESLYECHITIASLVNTKTISESIKSAVESIEWKYSRIDGDPVLGDGIKHYATTYFKNISRDDVTTKVMAAAQILIDMGINVVREKVEEIIYDNRNFAHLKDKI